MSGGTVTREKSRPSIDDPDFRRYVGVTSYFDLAISPDGATAACVSNTHGSKAVSLHALDPRPGAAKERVLPSPFDLAPDRVVWSPDASWLLVAADRRGTEQYELHAVHLADGTWRPLSCDAGVRHELGASPLSPDGHRIAYGSNARCTADFDVVLMDVRTGATRTLFATGEWLVPASWSPDGRHLVVSRFNLSTDQDLFLVDAITGAARHLTPHSGEAKFTPGPWTSDGRGFFVLSDRAREYTGLAFLDVATGSLEWLETPARDVEAIGLSRDESQLIWIENNRGDSALNAKDRSSGRVRREPCVDRGVIWNRTVNLSFCGPELSLAFYLSTPTTPWSLQRLDLMEASRGRITGIAPESIATPQMIEPERVRFPSSDGVMIDALIYAPAGRRSTDGTPCVLAIHGGPEAQERPSYGCNGLFQYLAHRGIGVVAPNVRGSTGYGRSFQKQIHRDFGGVDLMDLAAALRFLVDLDWVDPARVGVFGASYGGFAALSCVARIHHPWAAAVSIVPPLDLVEFARNVPPWWRRVMKCWMGDPDEDAALLRERSPTGYVDAIRAPVLLIHGANDPRVGHAQSGEMVRRLRALGRTAEYLGFADEGHTFASTENLLRVLAASADWLEEHLRAG